MQRFLPYAAAALLDAIDLATFGPMGIWVGFVLGALAGWGLAEYLGFAQRNRWMGATLAGLYCMMPGTHLLPLATMVTAIRQLSGKSDPNAVPPLGGKASGKSVAEPIVVDYRTLDDDERESR